MRNLPMNKSTLIAAGNGLLAVLMALSIGACAATDDSGDGSGSGSDGGGRGGRDGGGGGGEDGGGGSEDAVTTLDTTITEDTGNGTDDVVEFSCDLIGTGENSGSLCGEEDPGFCGDFGGCVSASADDDPTCAQICAPGNCEAMCTGGSRCVGLQDPNTGEALEFAPGIPAGACIDVPTGDAGAYDLCDAENLCQADSDCIGLVDIDGSFCSPRCTGGGAACPSRDTVAAQCALVSETGGEPANCALLCAAAADGTATGCPTGFICNAVDATNGICIPQ
jgi:hypothetical protein